MIRFKHDVKQIYFNELKCKVETRFGQDLINTNNAIQLQEDILKHTNKNISTSTLIRMFVSSSYNNIPYLNTLDILSEYATGKLWVSFCKNESTFIGQASCITDDSTLKLLEICFQNQDFISVLDYMKHLPGGYDEVGIRTQQNLANLFGLSVRNTDNRLAFTKELAKTRQGRFLFFETFVDIDNLTGYYGEALNFYERYGQSVDPKRRLNDHIFLHCVKFWKAWLSKDFKELKKIGFILFNKFHPEDITEENGVVFYPLARWHAYRLIYLNEANLLNDKIVDKAVRFIEKIISSFCSNKTVIVLSKLFESLLITGYHQFVYPLYLKYKLKIDLGDVNNDTFLPLLHYVKISLAKEEEMERCNKILLPKLDINLYTNRITYSKLQEVGKSYYNE